MKNTLFIVIFLCTCLASLSSVMAQSGSPPMITDDPGTPDQGGWEINLSAATVIKKNEKKYEVPLMDINYGLTDRIQLKFETPYVISKIDGAPSDRNFSGFKCCIKYRFLDGDSLTASVYPQIEVPREGEESQEYTIPVQVEKSFKTFVLGSSIGYTNKEHEEDICFGSILVGRAVSETTDIMAEIAFEGISGDFPEMEGLVNVGLSHALCEHAKFVASTGTSLFAPDTNDRTRLIAFVGLKTSF